MITDTNIKYVLSFDNTLIDIGIASATEYGVYGSEQDVPQAPPHPDKSFKY